MYKRMDGPDGPALMTHQKQKRRMYQLRAVGPQTRRTTMTTPASEARRCCYIYLRSIKGNEHTVIARSDLRRRVGIRRPNKRLLHRRRLAPERRHDVVGRGGVGPLRNPVVARGRVQHVRRARGALPAVARSALRAGVEEGAGGDVAVVVDVLGEPLGRAVRDRRQRRAPVAPLLQAHVPPGGAHHVQLHPRRRQVLPALHGADPAGVEGNELGVALVDGDGLEQGSAVVGIVAPKGKGLGGAAVGEEDADAIACRGLAFEEGFEGAWDPGAGSLGLGWGGEDRGDGGGEG